MNVVPISVPSSGEWRWRIVDYSGQMLEESAGTFPSIDSAVADGVARMRARQRRDVTAPGQPSQPGNQ
jgi:hypothetical protein